MYVDLIFLCFICIFNVKYSNRGGKGAWGELSRAVLAEREREREQQVDGPNLVGCWMVAV
jgi:hypothetical protein